MLHNELFFFFGYLFLAAVEHDCKVNLIPLTCCSDLSECPPEPPGPLPAVDIPQVLCLAAPEVIGFPDVDKPLSYCNCVDDLDPHF